MGFPSILMATTPQAIEPEVQQDPETGEAMQQEAPPKQDYGEWNENLPENLQDTLKKLAGHYCDEFRYARRMEVMQAWRARSRAPAALIRRSTV